MANTESTHTASTPASKSFLVAAMFSILAGLGAVIFGILVMIGSRYATTTVFTDASGMVRYSMTTMHAHMAAVGGGIGLTVLGMVQFGWGMVLIAVRLSQHVQQDRTKQLPLS